MIRKNEVRLKKREYKINMTLEKEEKVRDGGESYVGEKRNVLTEYESR